ITLISCGPLDELDGTAFDQNQLVPNIQETLDDDDDDDDDDENINLVMFQMINLNQLYDNDVDENAASVRLSCFAQSLQLCVRDGLKNGSHMSKVLNKRKTLAKFSHKSSKMADILDEMNKSISKMNVTRWNSEFMLIKSILSIKNIDMEPILVAL
ncbi:unnamed protein product, partial [Adineta steineri]